MTKFKGVSSHSSFHYKVKAPYESEPVSRREEKGKSASEAIRRVGVSAGEKAARKWNYSRELKELCYR